MKNCLIHFYVKDTWTPGASTYICAECGARGTPNGIYRFLGRVVDPQDDEYNEWADVAHTQRGRRIREEGFK